MEQLVQCVSHSIPVPGHRTRSFVAWKFAPNHETTEECDDWKLIHRGADAVCVLHSEAKDKYYVRVNGGMDWVPLDYMDRCLEDERTGGLFRDLANFVRRQPHLKNYLPATVDNANAQFFARLGGKEVVVSFSYRAWGDFMCAVHGVRRINGYMQFY